MKAQIYFQDDEKYRYVRLFDGDENDHWLADIRLVSCDESSANIALATLGLRRTRKWKKTEWGLESFVALRGGHR